MSRNAYSTVIVVAVLFVTGCTGLIQEQSEFSGGEGQFTAQVVSSAPPDVSVNYTDDRVQANEYLQKAVRKAVNKSGREVVTVPEHDVEKTKRDLRQLPQYSPENGSDEYRWGYYIRYEQRIVNVEFAILD